MFGATEQKRSKSPFKWRSRSMERAEMRPVAMGTGKRPKDYTKHTNRVKEFFLQNLVKVISYGSVYMYSIPLKCIVKAPTLGSALY